MSGGIRRRFVVGATRLGRAVLAAAAASAVLAIAGCAEPDSAPTPTSTFVPGYVEPPETLFAPLTGRPAGSGEAAALALSGPSLAAKIDNSPAARPQFGLDRADLVFEELVEGGMTRYVAVWHSDVPDEIGPVRSIRPMDPDIISPLGGVVAYSGGQPRFVELMRRADVVNAVHGEPGTESAFFRTDGRSAPHNVLVTAPELLSQHADVAAPAQQFAYADSVAGATAAKEGVLAAGLELDFGGGVSRPSWAWDPDHETYLRSQGGAPDLDALGRQLGATNVVVLRVPVSTGLGVPKTELVGSGKAWVATGGGTVKATWSKDAATSPIRLVDQHGIVVRLAPGNTWIELLPEAGAARLVE